MTGDRGLERALRKSKSVCADNMEQVLAPQYKAPSSAGLGKPLTSLSSAKGMLCALKIPKQNFEDYLFQIEELYT